MQRARLGWALVGWLNLVALTVLVAGLAGAKFTLGWILAGALILLMLLLLLLWSTKKR